MRYHYTYYPNSKLATNFDKFCHTPARISIFAIPMLLAIYLAVISEYLPGAEALMDRIVTVLALLSVVFLIGSFFLGMLCNKCKLSAKLALWDIRRKENGGKLSPRFWIVTILILLILAAPGVLALTNYSQNRKAEEAYHVTMTALDHANAPAVTGNKAVTYHTQENRYSRSYIPTELQAEVPEDTRYILRCTDGEELYGMYENINVLAYRRICSVELLDRESGEVVAAELFYGGFPPSRVDENVTKPKYGSYPDAEEILTWVESVLS